MKRCIQKLLNFKKYNYQVLFLQRQHIRGKMGHFFNFKHRRAIFYFLLLFSCTLLGAIEHDFKIAHPFSAWGNKNTLITEDACEFLSHFVEPNSSGTNEENEIKVQLNFLDRPCLKIPLVEELFKIKLKSFEDQGLSILDFLQEAKERVKNTEYYIGFDKDHDNRKTEIFGLYHLLLYLTWDSTRITETSTGEFPLPFAHLYDFEREISFPLLGVRLLEAQLASNAITLLYLKIREDDNWWEPIWKSSEIATQSFWKPQLSFYKRLLVYLEDDRYTEVQYLKERIIHAVMDCFNFKIHKLFLHEKKECDPLIHLFPYVIKHKPIDDFKDYFHQRFVHMPNWDKEALWIDLHFRAVEATAKSDLVQAQGYLEKAEKEINKNLWAYYYSSNYSKWQEKRQRALTLLDDWKIKLAEIEMMQ